MKKLLLLLAGGFLATGVNAQSLKQAAGGTHLQPKTQDCSHAEQTTTRKKSTARTTATCFYTENFGTGTKTTLPSGWTAGIISGSGTWKWMNVGSSSAFSMGAMNSASAANGWMIFDSDSIGAACGSACEPWGWLQSPAINCASATTVRLSFDNYYRKYRDSSFVYVSTDPAFASYTVFPVLLNQNTAHNASTSNPSHVALNITTAAAGHAAVYLRFVSHGWAGGSYSWMIDDICVSQLDPHDVGLSNSMLDLVDVGTGATAYNGSLFTTPLKFVDSVLPLTFLSNPGANVENVNLSAEIWKSGTSVYTDNGTYNSLVSDATDSIVIFSAYKPTATGDYTMKIAATVAGDAVPANDADSLFFTITDTLWQQNAVNRPTGASGLYNTAIGSSPISTYMQGTRFDLPTTLASGDTISGFAAAFSSSSLPTGAGKVSIQLYSTQNDVSVSNWTYLGTSISKSLTAADYSTSTTVTWVDFRIDPVASGGYEPFILQPGNSYAAMIQIENVTTTLRVLTTEANPMGGDYYGFFGQSDSSQNGGGQDFGANLQTGDAAEVPMIRMFFGNIPTTAVKNVSTANVVGRAYPNPANTSVNIPFTTGVSSRATVTLTNAIGQVIRTQQISTTGGQQAVATFATSDLAAGVYLYTVEANGQTSTGRVSVIH